MTKVYFDENIPVALAHGMKYFNQPLEPKGQIEIHYLPDVLHIGVKDEDWIPMLGAEGAVIITHDFNIHRKLAQRELYHKHGLNLIFFNPPSKSGYQYWELVQQMVKRWEDIRNIILREKRPFAFRYTSRSAKAELI